MARSEPAPLQVAMQAARGAPQVASICATSLILRALVLVVSVDYAIPVPRADNRGKGGVVAMLAMLALLGARGGAAHPPSSGRCRVDLAHSPYRRACGSTHTTKPRNKTA